MNVKDQIRITEELLEGVKELNGEYQEGWENNILEAENLLKHLKQVKNNDLLHSVVESFECMDTTIDAPKCKEQCSECNLTMG